MPVGTLLGDNTSTHVPLSAGCHILHWPSHLWAYSIT